jgi:hypothetical protein
MARQMPDPGFFRSACSDPGVVAIHFAYKRTGGRPLASRPAAAQARPFTGNSIPPPPEDSPWRLTMLYTIALVLLVLWALGFAMSFTAGGLLHLLLVGAVIIFIVQLVSGRRVV